MMIPPRPPFPSHGIVILRNRGRIIEQHLHLLSRAKVKCLILKIGFINRSSSITSFNKIKKKLRLVAIWQYFKSSLVFFFSLKRKKYGKRCCRWVSLIILGYHIISWIIETPGSSSWLLRLFFNIKSNWTIS